MFIVSPLFDYVHVYTTPAKERQKKGEAHKPTYMYMSTNQNHTYEHTEHKTLGCPALTYMYMPQLSRLGMWTICLSF